MRLFTGLTCTLLVAAAAAQPVPRAQLSPRLLVADTTLDALYLAEDLTGDGDANDANEYHVYFGAGNAAGLAAPGAPTALTVSADGRVYFTDTDADSVYVLRDLNADGDAMDADEALLFFGPGNAGSLVLQTPNGIDVDGAGAVFVVTAGAGATLTADFVYRLADLNADGDAMDTGEATTWFDLGTLVPVSSAFAIAAVGADLFINDLRGGNPDQILRARDTDGNGTVSAAEFSAYADAAALGVPLGFALPADAGDLYVVENGGTSVNRVHRLRDADASGVITTGEAVLIWDDSRVPAGLTQAQAFDLAVGPGTIMALGSFGSADAESNVFFLEDLTGDGDYLDTGETRAFLTGHGGGVFPERVRALRFLPLPPRPPCDPDFNCDGNSDQDDVGCLIDEIAGNPGCGCQDPDFNHDGNVDQDDLTVVINVVAGGPCP